ncbi:O-antigen ligase family protein [Paenibacillus ihbetae]|uniref:Polymerase n=1 Tax=Paenibacillus ihbetae TaxID=1870820 RepID=A0A1B2E315_9BACL|nr:O-antigen ligase family protein [Paenibacillus ihbetae]ANY74384.1 polymerase [Paenibacillus ihbetae]OOC63436.1 polymerase [Paenibacillus ihbetae]
MGLRGSWYGGLLLTVLLLTACSETGWFFDSDLYLAAAGWAGLLLLLFVLRRNSGFQRFSYHRAALPVKPTNPYRAIAATGIGGILAIYVQHALRGPASMEGTLKELVLWGLYGSFAAAAWEVSRTAKGRLSLRLGWHLLGAVLCGSALLHVYGVLDLPYGIYHTADPAISATGARLGGLLQYPNTFGALMAAFLLERLFALAPALQARPGALRTAAALLPLLPYTAALLLTESRGAWLAAALACAAGLALERRRIAPLLIAAAAPLASAALVYRQLADAKLAPAVLPGLLWLAGLWAGGVLAGLLLCRLRHSGGLRRRVLAPAALVAAAAGYAAAGVAILHQVQDRALGGAATLSARRLIYSDAWQLAKSSLWLGQGGETWRHVYRAVQSQPYVGGEVHSGYLDMLLNTGIIGLLLVCALLLALIAGIAKACPRLLPPFLVLTLHAAIDFDWSYPLVWLLMLWLPAMGTGMAPPADWTMRQEGGVNAFGREASIPKRSQPVGGLRPLPIDAPGVWMRTPPQRLSKWQWISPQRLGKLCWMSSPLLSDLQDPRMFWRSRMLHWISSGKPTVRYYRHQRTDSPKEGFRRYFPGTQLKLSCMLRRMIPPRLPAQWHRLPLLLGFLCWAVLTASLGMSEMKLRFAASAGEAERRELLQAALSWNPANSAAAVGLSELLPPEQQMILLEGSLRYAPQHAGLSWRLAEAHALAGRADTAAFWYRKSLELDRYSSDKQTRAVLALTSLAVKQSAAGDVSGAGRSASAAMDMLQSYRWLAEAVHASPGVRNDRRFHLTAQAQRQAAFLAGWIGRGKQ